MKVIICMRNGGLWITEATREGDNVASLGRRMTDGGFTVFQDSLWGKPREIAINLADVSAIVCYPHETTVATDDAQA